MWDAVQCAMCISSYVLNQNIPLKSLNALLEPQDKNEIDVPFFFLFIKDNSFLQLENLFGISHIIQLHLN